MENNFVTRVSDLTGIDEDTILKRLSDLDVDSMMDVLSALTDGDREKVMSFFADDDSDEHESEHGYDSVTESVLGMSSIPDLARMQQLAGLPPTTQTPQLEIEIEPTRLQPVYDGNGDDMSLEDVMDAFDRIERSVGGLLIRDAKCVRERVNRLLSKLMESTTIRKRKA